jgi:hypothetical protein
MPRTKMFSIAPEDKRSVAVTLKLTERENELLTKYAAQLDSDKSYVAGKIIEAFIPQALSSNITAAEGVEEVNRSGKKHSDKQPAMATA